MQRLSSHTLLLRLHQSVATVNCKLLYAACYTAKSSAEFLRHLSTVFQDEIEMDEFPFREEMHHSSAEELFHFMASKLVRFADRLNKRLVAQSPLCASWSLELSCHCMRHDRLVHCLA